MKALSYTLMGILIIFSMIGSISSCNKDQTPPAVCVDTVSFASQIQPMIELNCSTSGCHDAASSAGGKNLVGYSNISSNAITILSVIRHETTPMPLGQPKLNDTLIDQFNCWTVQGKLNN